MELIYQETSHGKAPNYAYARIVGIKSKGKIHYGVDSNYLGYKSFEGKGSRKRALKFYKRAQKRGKT